MLYQPQHTGHALTRMAQRHLSFDEVDYVLQYGERYYCAGVVHFYLRRKDIPEADRRDSRFSRLEGTVVLMDSLGREAIITVYRNRGKHALKDIRRKAKYNRSRNLVM